jgi:uncharacterized protein (DUF1501 family)
MNPAMTDTLPPSQASRRLFLQRATTLGALAGAGAPVALNLLAAGSAAAQAAPDYKAIVCLFLFGGNDTYNMVLPTDAASWQAYSSTRNQLPDSIALLAAGVQPNTGAAAGSPARLGGVLPLNALNANGLNNGRSFALHPLMGRAQTLFNTDRRLAIVPNVGPLLRPTTKAQYALANHPKPASLFSHNDQQNTWQALAAEGATRGWGGRMGDALAAMNSRTVFTSVSASGNAVWLAGQTVQQYQVSSNGAIRMGADSNGRIYGSAAVTEALQRIAGGSRSNHAFERDLAAISARSIDAETTLRGALRAPSDPLFGTAPASGNYNAANDPKLRYVSAMSGQMSANPLAQQLQVVARLIDAGISGATGVRRQVFFVSMGGFDTHDQQNLIHADLMARLDQALGYFDTTLGAMGARSNVTLFTASDFGRTFTSNGDGTDHGWGGHHLVMGGAVRGGELYSRFPTLGVKNANNNNFDSIPDQLGNGALLPETSVDQLGATLGRWFGCSDGTLAEIFPNLANFDAGRRNLGFLG